MGNDLFDYIAGSFFDFELGFLLLAFIFWIGFMFTPWCFGVYYLITLIF